MCVCTCLCMHSMTVSFEGQRTISGSLFFIFITWVLKIELRSSSESLYPRPPSSHWPSPLSFLRQNPPVCAHTSPALHAEDTSRSHCVQLSCGCSGLCSGPSLYPLSHFHSPRINFKNPQTHLSNLIYLPLSRNMSKQK